MLQVFARDDSAAGCRECAQSGKDQRSLGAKSGMLGRKAMDRNVSAITLA
jgi:hypothetical protein